MKNKISIIVPTYNVEQYIEQCIESINLQTYKNFEVIVVNDGSTDNTLNVIKKCKEKYDWIEIINNDNHGQGYSRNRALEKAKGEYIFFFDSDDFIEPLTLELALKRIQEDNSDLVVYDWKNYYQATGEYKYINKDAFFSKRILEGNECIELLKIKHYFTVNKLYRKSFLLDNNIQYGEGYIYEDVPFWTHICACAKKVSLIHSPLYNVRVNKTSTTKSNYNSENHYTSFLKAMEESINILKENNAITEAYYYLYNYFIRKFNLYYRKRVPRKYKKVFMNEFVELMSKTIKLTKEEGKNKYLGLGLKEDLFYYNKKKTIHFTLILARIKQFVKTKLRKVKQTIKFVLEKLSERKISKENIILFMGFDYRYTGNSRYLFEDLIKIKQDNVYFVTNDTLVDEKYRIVPKSKKMYKILNTAKVVIFESWISKKFNKNKDAIWVQLWHGTPLKKMLFDSEEAEIITTNPNHKINKYNDINRWDYLLMDNPSIAKYFRTSFLIKDENIINYGYPRVKYLLDNMQNNELKDKIKEKCNIDKNKRIVLYLPTWRDYNYGKKQEQQDFEYFLNTEVLTEKLGNDYIIISKNHVFLNSKSSDSITNVDTETQELLLIADYLITDYSSVLFDAFAIDLPTVLLANDYEKYSKSRGVYKEIWDDLAPFIVNNEIDLAKKIKSYKINKEYLNVKEKYAYKNIEENELQDFIIKLSKGE